MQSYLQYRQFYRELEKQIVIKREEPDNVWTNERQYWYNDNGIGSTPRDPDDGAPAERRRTHGHNTVVGGPRIEPQHTTRSHLNRDGDVERADLDPEVQADPYTINTRDSIGTDVDMMVTGLERGGPANQASNHEQNCVPDGDADGVAEGGSSKHEKLIMISYEGDCDPMDPHNWPFLRKVGCTVLLSLLGAIAIWSTKIDASALPSISAQFNHTFEQETVPTGRYYSAWIVSRIAHLQRSTHSDWPWDRWTSHSTGLRSRRPQLHLYDHASFVHAFRYGRGSRTKHGPAMCLPGFHWPIRIRAARVLLSSYR